MAEGTASGPRRPSFRRRLALGVGLLCACLLAAAGAGIYAWARAALQRTLDESLVRIAISEAAAAVDEPADGVHVHDLPADHPGWSADPDLGARLIEIKDAAGRVLAYSSNLSSGPAMQTDRALEARALGGVATIANLSRGDARLRGIYYPLRDAQNRPLVMVVAVPTAKQRALLNSLLAGLVGILVAGAAAGAVAAQGLARRLTRPLERIARSARSFGESNLGHRIPEVSPDAELHELSSLLNEMFERLQRAFVARERAIEAQRRFVADASHELRSPLSNLRGTIEVTLHRPRTADEYRAALEIALDEVERLSRLVAALLTLSRAEGGALASAAAACDLADVARDAVGAHSARAAAARIELVLDADAEPVIVRGDVDQLRQVADNLLDNALRYSPPGSRVRVAATLDGGHALLSVADQGPGMSPEDCARAFDRFYRADGSRDRKSGGTGLGLAIVKAIVDAHRGTVSASSLSGAGSSFTVRLPATQAR